MPFVTIQIAEGHSVEQKRELAKAVTSTIVSSLGTKPEWGPKKYDKVGQSWTNCPDFLLVF